MYTVKPVYKLSGTVHKKWKGNVLDKIIIEDTPYVIYKIIFEGITWYDIYKNEELITSRNTSKSAIEHAKKLIEKEIKQTQKGMIEYTE